MPSLKSPSLLASGFSVQPSGAASPVIFLHCAGVRTERNVDASLTSARRAASSLMESESVYFVPFISPQLPTEYIFVYVEKRPIQYAQSHFFTGPDWLAEEKYTSYYTTYFSEGNSINASEISREQAEKEMMTFSKLSQTYSNLDSRTILESKAYEWCRKFEASYPQEMKVYYEDENFCCYMIRQNTYRLYQLEES